MIEGLKIPIRRKSRGKIAVYAGVFLRALLFFSIGLGAASRSKGTERYFLLAGYNMVQTGDWITPVYEGKPRFQKPPLAYWLVAVFYKLLRRPSVVSPAAVRTGGRPGGDAHRVNGGVAVEIKEGGLLASLFLATCTGYLIQSRMAMTDIFLLLFFLMAMMLYAKELFSAEKSLLRRLGMWASMAMAFLAKGHLGVIMPLMIAVGLGIQRDFSFKNAFRP